MMETLKNTIFSFLGPDTFQIFIFEYSLTKKIAITQEPQLLFPSSLDYIFSVSVPLGIKWKTYIEGVRGCHQKKKCSKMTLSRWKTSINNWKCIFLDSTSQRPLKDCWSWEGIHVKRWGYSSRLVEKFWLVETFVSECLNFN